MGKFLPNIYPAYVQDKYIYEIMKLYFLYTRVSSSSLTGGFQDLNIYFRLEYHKTFEQSNRL